MKQKKSFSTRALTAVGKVALFAAMFPYQVTLNRKEGTMGVRSFLFAVSLRKKTNEEGKKSLETTLNCPGFAFREAKKSFSKRKAEKEKKKEKKKHKKLLLKHRHVSEEDDDE